MHSSILQNTADFPTGITIYFQEFGTNKDLEATYNVKEAGSVVVFRKEDNSFSVHENIATFEDLIRLTL